MRLREIAITDVNLSVDGGMTAWREGRDVHGEKDGQIETVGEEIVHQPGFEEARSVR